MSEAGRPLLYSSEENTYDDAKYLVNHALERPLLFQGGTMNARKVKR